jgi:hypothetical protein
LLLLLLLLLLPLEWRLLLLLLLLVLLQRGAPCCTFLATARVCSWWCAAKGSGAVLQGGR